MTDARADGPARTLAEGGTFMWEQWSPACATSSPCADPAQSNSESQSHGWGSWGIVDMLETLLGVQVTAPGAATVAIAPPVFSDRSSPRAIEGSVWTQRGTVAVSWRKVDGGYLLDADVPANVRAEVRIPGAHDAARVRASGAGAPRLVRIDEGDAVFSVGSGRSHFEPRTPGEEGREPGPPANPPGTRRRDRRRRSERRHDQAGAERAEAEVRARARPRIVVAVAAAVGAGDRPRRGPARRQGPLARERQAGRQAVRRRQTDADAKLGAAPPAAAG